MCEIRMLQVLNGKKHRINDEKKEIHSVRSETDFAYDTTKADALRICLCCCV